MRGLSRSLIITSLALFMVSAAFGQGYPVEDQILTNPGFELDADEDGVPDGWNTGPDRAVRRETVFMGGGYELASVRDSYVLATQEIRLEPGETYTIAFSAKGSGGGQAGALIVHGEETPTSEMPLIWGVPLDEEFSEFGRTFQAPNPVARLYIYNTAREGEVVYDWVSLTKGEADRAYIGSFDFGERDTPIEEPVVRQHRTWATPLPGGPIRSLVTLYNYRTVREVVELSHRLAMDYNIVTGDYDGTSLTSPDGREVQRTMEEGGYEVYVVSSRLDDRFEEEIRANVEAGAGLVVISGFGSLEQYCDLEDLEEVTDDHYLVRDLPWEHLPAEILRAVRVGQIGEGRVVHLDLDPESSRAWGIMPVENDHTAWMNREMRYWEYWFAFLARAVYYAARGGNDMRIKESPDHNTIGFGGVSPELRDAAETIEVTVRHSRELRWGEPDLSYPTQTLHVGGDGTFAFPEDIPDGELIIDVIIRDANGAALYWGCITTPDDRAARITEIDLGQDSYVPGDTIVAAVSIVPAPPAGTMLEARMVDSWGRVVAETQIDAEERASLVLQPPAEMLLTTGHKLFVKLMQDGHEIDSAWTDVFYPQIGNAAPLRDWHIDTWGDGFTNPYISEQYSRMLMELGFTGKFGSWAYATAETPLIPGLHGQAGAPFSGRAKVEDGARVPCLSNPEVIDEFTAEAPEEIAAQRQYGHFAVNIRDEATLTSRHERREVCFSEWCQARYRQWLEDLYGDIAALNESWGTDHASFDQITGATTEDVRGTDNFAPFVDFRTFMTDVWVDGMRRITEAYEEGWPEIRVGHTNTFGAMPTNGNDFWKLCTVPGFEWAQEYSEAIKPTAQKAVFELWRSFLPGRTGEDFPNYGWIGYDHSAEAVRYEPWWLAFHDSGGTTYYATNAVDPLRGKSWALIHPTQAWTTYSREVEESVRDLREGVGKALIEARRADPQVAILWSHPSMLVAWCESDWTQPVPPETAVDDSYGSYFKSAFYFRLALQELQLMYNYVAPDQILAGELDRYDLLFLPFTCAISDETADAIEQWVEAGGTLVADMRFAVTDEHGAPRDGTLLERLFGVRRVQPEAIYELATVIGPGGVSFDTSAHEIVERVGDAEFGATYADGTPAAIYQELGTGRTAYFNCLLPKYDPVALGMLYELLEDAGIERRVAVDTGDAQNPPRAWECARYVMGDGPGAPEIVGLIRDHRLVDEPQTAMVDFGREAFVYDMRDRRSHGRTRTIEATLEPGEAGAWALLPYEVTGVNVSLGAGGSFEVQLIAAGEVGDHVLHLTVTGPDGEVRPAYTKNVLAEKGGYKGVIPFAANDPTGEWTLTVRDVFSGVVAQASFTR